MRDPQDLALIAAAAMGACFGFLWWNAKPAQIFMGDTGSMALGGLMAGLAILSRTELLLVVLGGLFAVVTLSSVIQTGWFKYTRIRTGTGRRVFRMAPFHHHFELGGWDETPPSSGSGSSAGWRSPSEWACSMPNSSRTASPAGRGCGEASRYRNGKIERPDATRAGLPVITRVQDRRWSDARGRGRRHVAGRCR